MVDISAMTLEVISKPFNIELFALITARYGSFDADTTPNYTLTSKYV